MKRLTWPFKKSPSFRFTQQSAVVCSALILIAFGSALSCRHRIEKPTEKKPEPNKFVSLLFSNGLQATTEIARLEDSFCRTQESERELWVIPFTSPFGDHTIKINYAFAAKQEPILVQIDQISYLIEIQHFLNKMEMTNLCVGSQTGNPFVTNDESLRERLKDTLNRIAPVCEFTLIEDRWHCTPKSVKAETGLAQLQELKRHMVTHWSRHPYLLTRRVALAITLGEALTSHAVERDMQRFCDILSYSLPDELPLAFRTKSWRQAVCDTPGSKRQLAAEVGLHEARIEIETLKHELESASRLGTLVVRIPATASPFKDFWVTLAPVNETDAPWKNTSHYKMFNLCWHPLYHEDASFNFVAIDLGLIDVEKANHCRQSMVTSQYTVTLEKDYILSSITSESEFPLTNGRGKVLRLPEGEYEYTLQEHLQQEPWETPPSKEISRGTISWKTRRPAPIINQW